MKYERVEADNRKEAERLFKLGYRQISNKFGIVARIEVPDLVAALKEKLPFSSSSKWERWMQEDQWRRCYSKDRIDGVDPKVMGHLRKMSDFQQVTGQDIVVVCVDNVGIEECFDRGVEYLAIRFVGEMAHVFDKRGKSQECLAKRFVVLP